MKILLVLLAAVAVNAEIQLVSEWNAFKRQYNKTYKPMEDIMRKNNYYRNKERINSHNYLYSQGVHTFRVGMNQFGDWTEQEYKNIFRSGQFATFDYVSTSNRWIGTTSAPLTITSRPSRRPGLGAFTTTTAEPSTAQPTTTEIPLFDPNRPELAMHENYYLWFQKRRKRQAPSLSHAARDWRLEGAVNAVRDQTVMGKSQCNAGWAFAAVAVMEAHDSKHPSGLQEFSEQNLLDCIAKDLGCGGMTPKNAFDYVVEKGNINPLGKYAYKGRTGQCMYDEDDFGTAGVKAVQLTPMNEDVLMEVVAEEGPVAVGFDPTPFSFMFYKSGVFNERTCEQGISKQNHFMTVVGFDEHPEWGKYWIVRNSFGTTWGENGYIRVPMGLNTCGISYQPSYIVV